jgi:hypothetical protein
LADPRRSLTVTTRTLASPADVSPSTFFGSEPRSLIEGLDGFAANE